MLECNLVVGVFLDVASTVCRAPQSDCEVHDWWSGWLTGSAKGSSVGVPVRRRHVWCRAESVGEHETRRDVHKGDLLVCITGSNRLAVARCRDHCVSTRGVWYVFFMNGGVTGHDAS